MAKKVDPERDSIVAGSMAAGMSKREALAHADIILGERDVAVVHADGTVVIDDDGENLVTDQEQEQG